MLTVVPGAADADDPGRPDGGALIDEIVREGARRMLAEALQAEVDDHSLAYAGYEGVIGVGRSRNYREHGSYPSDRRWRADLA